MAKAHKQKPAESRQATGNDTEQRSTPSLPLIFISHDTRDAELAEHFSKLLSSVTAGMLKSFRSSDRKGSQGIEYGTEWYPELMKKLDSASVVVCLLTPRSLERPWILYEAGVAKGKLDTPVYGIALGIPLSQANTGPFAQFQNCDYDEESLTKLVMQLVAKIPGTEPDRDVIQAQVKAFITRATEVLENSKGTGDPKNKKPEVEDASVAKLFEEVKVMFQDLPTRLEDKLSSGGDSMRRRRYRRIHPMMLDEITHSVADGPDDPIQLLVLSSLLREDFPWLAELGMEAYRAAREGDMKHFDDAIRRFRRAAEMSRRGPIFEEMGMSSKETHMFMMELPFLLERITKRFARRGKPHAKQRESESDSPENRG